MCEFTLGMIVVVKSCLNFWKVVGTPALCKYTCCNFRFFNIFFYMHYCTCAKCISFCFSLDTDLAELTIATLLLCVSVVHAYVSLLLELQVISQKAIV